MAPTVVGRPTPGIWMGAVTTLRVKTRSFSGGVRLKAPSKPFDNHSRYLVTREGEMTTGAMMPPLTQVLGHRLPAHAGLAGATWMHSDHRPASFRRFTDEDRNELAPCSVVDRPGQAVVLHHVLDRQDFVVDRVVRPYQDTGCLVVEVPAHVRHALVLPCDATALLGPPVAATLLAREGLLRPRQPGLGLTQHARVRHRNAGVSDQEVDEPQVDAHVLARGGQGRHLHVAGEHHVPLAT